MISPHIAQLLLSDPYGSLALVEKDPTSTDAKEILAQWKEGIPVTEIPGGLILQGRQLLEVRPWGACRWHASLSSPRESETDTTIGGALAKLSKTILNKMSEFHKRSHLPIKNEEDRAEFAEYNRAFSWYSDIPGVEFPKTRTIVGRLVSLTEFRPVQSDMPRSLRVESGANQADIGKVVMGSVPCYRDGSSFDDDALVTITPNDPNIRRIIDLAEKHNNP